MCLLDIRWSYDAIVASEDFDVSTHSIFISFNSIAYHPNLFYFFRYSHIFFDHFDLWFHWEDIHESIFSRSCRHMLEPCWMTFFKSWKSPLDIINGALAFLILSRNYLVWVLWSLLGSHLLLSCKVFRIFCVLHWNFVPQARHFVKLRSTSSVRLWFSKFSIMTLLQLCCAT